MLNRSRHLPILVVAWAIVWSLSSTVQAQNSISELQKILQEKAEFQETDFAALERGETVVKLSPVQDKREVAVSGLVSLRAGAEEFLRSYRESLTRKSNAAVLEIGSFGSVPALADLGDLTLEAKDLEDLKECVVGDCQVKLSAAMIERFRREVDWQAADYAAQATELFRRMLLEYVQDYSTRGDAALIQYHDKRDEVRLADEQQALAHVSGYLNDVLAATQLARRNSELQLLEDMIVWSKIKFGLKPVIAINHIRIYKRDREFGPQVLIASKQIYANHYFNSSLALTAFVTVAGASPISYLVYENRSRADGLEGPFAKIKRQVVESKAVEGLKGVLEHSRLMIEAQNPGQQTATAPASHARNWNQRLFGGVRPLLWFLIISALIALFALRTHEGKTSRAGVKHLKPEQGRTKL